MSKFSEALKVSMGDRGSVNLSLSLNKLDEKPSASEVRIGRLERRIEKLKHQLFARDALILKHDGMMQRYPHIGLGVQNLEKHYAEVQCVRALEQRCKEQAALIVLLQKQLS
jgi:hypothetical protein